MTPRSWVCTCVMLGLFAGLTASGKPARALDEERQALHRQAVKLVEELGSSEFRTRRRAERLLAHMGLPAKDALLAGLRSRDAEVRDRCRRLLVVVLELDYQARVDAFATDPEGKLDHQLPGWNRYRKLVGETAGARQLFVDMQRSESKLLEATEADVESAAEVLAARCEQLQQSASRQMDEDGQPLGLGSIAAAFFVGSDPAIAMNDRLASYLYNFSYQPALQTAMRSSGPKTAALKRLLGAWVSRTASSNNAYPGMVLAVQYDLPEGLEPATALIKQTGAPPHFLQFAILVVGRFGGKEHVGLLEPLLENSTPLVTQNFGGQKLRTEVRDVALATLVHLTQQDAKQYGLNLEKHPQTLFDTRSIGFASEEARAAALRRWKKWSESQPASR